MKDNVRNYLPNTIKNLTGGEMDAGIMEDQDAGVPKVVKDKTCYDKLLNPRTKTEEMKDDSVLIFNELMNCACSDNIHPNPNNPSWASNGYCTVAIISANMAFHLQAGIAK